MQQSARSTVDDRDLASLCRLNRRQVRDVLVCVAQQRGAQ